MRFAMRSLGVSVVCCVLSTIAGAGSAWGQAAPTLAGPARSLTLDSLVVPGVQGLDGGQQLRAAEAVRRADPGALAARRASRTAYRDLSPAQAASLARHAFPVLVNDHAGGTPALPSGQSVTGFPSDDAMSIDLGGGRRGVVQSTQPIAVEASPGRRVPLDLSLSGHGSAFTPVTAAVRVSIPKHLNQGVQLPGAQVSLTPVDAQGQPLNGSVGAIDGSGVLYANTVTDGDSLIKPTALGFSAETLLRSIDSPNRLFFRVGLPRGGSLTESRDGSGAAEVTDEGAVLASVPAPSAQDAAGTPVAVSMSVAGDILSLTVGAGAGEYQYPIEVDPAVADTQMWLHTESEPGNWVYNTDNPGAFNVGAMCAPTCRGFGNYITNEGVEPYPTYSMGQWAYLEYPTQGKSRIYAFGAKIRDSEWEAAAGIEGSIQIRNHSGAIENGGTARVVLPKATLSAPYNGEVGICLEAGCAPGVVTAANAGGSAMLETYATTTNNDLFTYELKAGSAVWINQESGPSASFDVSDATVGGAPNGLYGGHWASGAFAKLAVVASDPGIGIYADGFSSPEAGAWGHGFQVVSGCEGVQCNECWNVAAQCTGYTSISGEPLTFSLSGLPDGKDSIEAKVEDATGLSATVTSTVMMDSSPPHALTLTGLPAGNEISETQGPVKLKASATDGSGTLASSGVASLRLLMDGREVGAPSTGCSSGPCTANGEWTIAAEEFGSGKHTLAVVATDNVGNVAQEEIAVTVHHAAPIAAGPGVLNPVTGEFGLSASDVSASGPGATLSVERSYNSRHLTAGVEGPLGPQWSLSLLGEQSLVRTPSGNMVLTGGGGGQSTFTSNGKGGFNSPAGDAGLLLSEKVVGKATEFLLAESGTLTTFAVPTGGSGGVWMPLVQEGAGGTNAITFSFATVEAITEPTEELAPVPPGISCSPTLKKGCRALTFSYAKETTASGEAASQWGESKGRLVKVSFTAYSPSSKEMQTSVVAQYSYDHQGRLRAEWNPTISSTLKTTYGYDATGHVTAWSTPGQQPFIFAYGTIVGDASAGRILSFTRPGAATALGSGEAPANTAGPVLSSTTPAVGVKLSVSGNGTWSNSPLAYAYQWEDCNASGLECTAIPGAVNQSYYPAPADEGHRLVAQVTAQNTTGSVAAVSAATTPVASGTPSSAVPPAPALGSSAVSTIVYRVPVSGAGAPDGLGASEIAGWGQEDAPVQATAVYPPDEPMGWPAQDYRRATVYYLDGKDRAVNTASPGGTISTTEYNATNDVKRTLSPGARAAALKEGGKSAEASRLLDNQSTYNEEGTELLETLGAQHTVKLPSGAQVLARKHVQYHYDEGAPATGGPYRLVTKLTEGAQYSGKEEDVRTVVTSYSGQNSLGWKLHKPTSVTADPTGLKVVHRTLYEPRTGAVTETRQPAAGAGSEEGGHLFRAAFGSSGVGNGQFKEPHGVAIDSSGDLYVSDTANNRVQVFTFEGTYLKTITGMSKPQGVAIDSEGNIWVADAGNNRIDEYTSHGALVTNYWSGVTFKEPRGVTTDASGDVWVSDTGNNRLVEFKRPGPGVLLESRIVGAKGSGEKQFNSPGGIAIGASGKLYVADTLNNRIEMFSGEGVYAGTFGSLGSGNGQLNAPQALATDSEGNVWVADTGNSRVQELSVSGSFIQKFASEGTGSGQLKAPAGIAVDPEGDVWVADTANSRMQQWGPHGAGYETGKESPHDNQTIYYTAGVNSKVTACGEHPEWAGLACQTQPAKQPEGSLPKLPVSTFAYNIWDEVEKTAQTAGTNTRTTTGTYDAAGRLLTSSVTSTVGTALPTVTEEYNSETGLLAAQSTTVEGKTHKLANVFNTLGQLVSFTDADGNESTYGYDIDGRIEKTNDGRGTQTSTYDATTGELTKLVDSAAGTFTATYDANRNMLSEGYPNGMSANYTYDQTGRAIALQYVKTTHCTSGCTWFSDSVVPSIHGQVLAQASSLSSQSYTYDGVGHLTQVQSTPSGKGCTTRLYGYDEDSNRTSLTTREPGLEGKCASEGGTNEKHTYDEADRLTDAGTSYDGFGNTTALPAGDAGGTELTSTYYASNQLATQTQNGETIGYQLDPAGRTRETISTGKTSSTTISHYAGPGPGEHAAWTVTTLGEWTRQITGINGLLTAVQSNSETPVLQLTNLHGDIVATAYLSETATGLASTGDTTEFGVPSTSMPPRYSWLGANEIPTELPSGVEAMGARSYVPQVGRFLQSDPVPGGAANAYTYTNGDPVDESDLSGAYDASLSAAVAQAVGQEAAEAAAKKAAEEAAARAAAEAQARAAAEQAAADAAMEAEWEGYWASEYEEYEEYEEDEGWGYAYASLHGENGVAGGFSATIQDAVLLTGGEGQPGHTSAGEAETPRQEDVRRVSCAIRGTCHSKLVWHPPSGTQCTGTNKYHPAPPGERAEPGYSTPSNRENPRHETEEEEKDHYVEDEAWEYEEY